MLDMDIPKYQGLIVIIHFLTDFNISTLVWEELQFTCVSFLTVMNHSGWLKNSATSHDAELFIVTSWCRL